MGRGNEKTWLCIPPSTDKIARNSTMTIKEFIDKDEYFDRYQFCTEWNGYTVYDVWAKSNEGACVGYPQFALEKNGAIRLSTIDETLQIMAFTRDTDNEVIKPSNRMPNAGEKTGFSGKRRDLMGKI